METLRTIFAGIVCVFGVLAFVGIILNMMQGGRQRFKIMDLDKIRENEGEGLANEQER